MSDLSAEAITAALTTRRLGRPVLYFPRIGSTNDVAHERAAGRRGRGPAGDRRRADGRPGAARPALVGAAGQQPVDVALLRPALPPDQAGQLTMCLGLAAVEAIEAVTGLRPALKWPNDLLLEDRKLGGMLTELRLDGERLAYAVLGLGVNVNVTFDEGRRTKDEDNSSFVIGPSSDLADTAISLSMVLGREVDRMALLAALLARCEAWYERALAGESPHAAWAARLDTVGRRVTVATTTGSVAGMAVGVTPEGALLVRDDDAAEHVIWSGDVTALRRAE